MCVMCVNYIRAQTSASIVLTYYTFDLCNKNYILYENRRNTVNLAILESLRKKKYS